MKKFYTYCIFFFIACSCKEKFIANIQSPNIGYLVVEGFINGGQGPTTITLSRSVKLYDAVNTIYELNAIVTIESESNEYFPVLENGNGVYTSASLNLNSNEKYRLHIVTADQKEYASDFVPFKHTPDIDSISWQRENDGLKIYVSTHDPLNNTRYYKWDYEETWEIHSRYLSYADFVTDPVTGQITSVASRNPAPDPALYRCWQSVISTGINLGTTEKLNNDIIYLPLVFIEPASEKLSILYSIYIKQYALSNEAYLFFQKIKKNTEQVGSVFDPQPSELKGNIHCITDPGEIVIGYVDISEEKTQRIFISAAEVPDWGYRPPCSEILIKNKPDSIFGLGYVPTDVASYGVGNRIETFHASSEFCVDCRTRGTNIKPSFWP